MSRKFDPEFWEGDPVEAGCSGDSCSLGAECPCWISGEEEGAALAHESIMDEVLDTCRTSIEDIFRDVLRPLEDRLILHGDRSAQPEINHLMDLKRRILEAVR